MIVPFDEESDKRTYTFTNCWNNTVYYHGNVPNNEFKLYKKVTIVLGKSVSSKESFQFTLGKSDYMKISNINLKNDKLYMMAFKHGRNGTPIVVLMHNLSFILVGMILLLTNKLNQ